MDNQSLPTSTNSQANTPEPVLAKINPQQAMPPSGDSDALGRATLAIESIVTQTAQNPAARLRAIADIKAAYIREQFGVDVSK